MKKIGILYGMEHSFPPALVEYINSKKKKGVHADFIKMGAVKMDDIQDYTVILDRVSDEVGFYRSMLKGAVINGIQVINNPFWTSDSDKFFYSSLAIKLGLNVPKTVVLPSKEHPIGTSADSMRNLIYPLDWERVFDYVGFPAYIKPNHGYNAYHAYKVYNPSEFFSAYDLTGDRVMILQENLEYEKYFRCYVIGRKHVKIMKYDPKLPHHLRYSPEPPDIDENLKAEIEKISLKICKALGFDFNSLEFAIQDGLVYVTEFHNTLPSAEKTFLHEENFNWLVAATGDYLIELALEGKYYSSDYPWSPYLRGPKSPIKRKKAGRLKKLQEKAEE
jgi:glutathione synthase/RimK-type ligase-like ATP-grasp enzyme